MSHENNKPDLLGASMHDQFNPSFETLSHKNLLTEIIKYQLSFEGLVLGAIGCADSPSEVNPNIVIGILAVGVNIAKIAAFTLGSDGVKEALLIYQATIPTAAAILLKDD